MGKVGHVSARATRRKVSSLDLDCFFLVSALHTFQPDSFSQPDSQLLSFCYYLSLSLLSTAELTGNL